MKKFIILFLVSSLFIKGKAQTSIWDGVSSDTSWYSETETEYHISNAAQLKGLADLVNTNSLTFAGKVIVLETDIDLNNLLWTPIGNGYSFGQICFKGNFNGNSHTINNVVTSNTVNPYGMAAASDYYCLGFFGVVKEGKIAQLKINGEVTVENGYGCQNAGGLVGYANNSTIEKVISNFKLKVKQENGYGLLLGGVAGDASTSSFVSVSSSGEVEYYNSARMRKSFGGISAKAKSLDECSSDFKIVLPASGAENCYIGGLAGYAGTITDAIFTGSINIYDYWNKQNVFVGGIVGQSGNNITNVISAPSSFYVQTQTPNLYQGLIVPVAASASITNAIYLSGITNNPGANGVPIAESDLKSGNNITGFSEEKWVYKQGQYPALKSIIDFDEGPIELPEVKGDLNNDGKVDIADAVIILNLMAEGSNESAVDLNGDGKVDIADFVSVLDLMAEQ